MFLSYSNRPTYRQVNTPGDFSTRSPSGRKIATSTPEGMIVGRGRGLRCPPPSTCHACSEGYTTSADRLKKYSCRRRYIALLIGKHPARSDTVRPATRREKKNVG